MANLRHPDGRIRGGHIVNWGQSARLKCIIISCCVLSSTLSEPESASSAQSADSLCPGETPPRRRGGTSCRRLRNLRLRKRVQSLGALGRNQRGTVPVFAAMSRAAALLTAVVSQSSGSMRLFGSIAGSLESSGFALQVSRTSGDSTTTVRDEAIIISSICRSVTLPAVGGGDG